MILSIKFEGSKALSNQNLITLVGNAGHLSAGFPLLSHEDYVMFSPEIQVRRIKQVIASTMQTVFLK